MDDNDLDVTGNSGQFKQSVEKAKNTAQTTRKAGSEIKKLAKKKLKNTKNVKLKKAFETAGKIASKLGPAIPYIIIAIIIIIVVVGLVAFIISMPGMITGKLKEIGQRVGDWFEALIDGRADAYTNKEDIIETANYIKSMGYDLIGYGFVPANPLYSSDIKDVSELKKEGYIDSDGKGIYKKDSGEIYTDRYIGDDGYIYVGSTGMKYEGEAAGSYIDKYGITYTTSGDETGAAGTYETSGKIIDFSDSTDLSLLRTYLMSDIKSYIIRNFDRTEETKFIINALAVILSGGSYTPGYTESEKWAYGLISLYNATEGIANSTYKSIQTGKIKIDATSKTMTIKGGWGSNPIEYSMAGWTGRYGLSLEFLISLHLATMSPELVDTITRTYNTDIQVYLDTLESAEVVAYFKTDDGQYLTLAGMQEETGADAGLVISKEDAFNIMKEYGIESKNYGVFKCNYSAEPKVIYLNGESSTKSYGKVLQNSNNYVENVIYGKGDDGTDEYDDIKEMNSWTDVEGSSSKHIDKDKLNEIVKNINDTINKVKTEQEGYTDISTEKTVNSISDLEKIISFSEFKNEKNTIIAKQCEIFVVNHAENSYNNGTIRVKLLVYRTSVDHNWDMAVLAYKEASEAELNNTEDLCSDHFEDGTITEVCDKCEDYVEAIRGALKATKEKNFDGKVPYIARVLDSWFRDTYFVIPTDDADDKAIELAYGDNVFDKGYSHSEIYGTTDGKIKLTGREIQLINVDDEYLEDTGENWTKYEIDESTGEYILYILNEDGTVGDRWDGTEETAEQQNIKLTKKAITTASGDLEESESGNLVWSAYNFDSTPSNEKEPVDVADTDNEDIKNVSRNEDNDYEDRIYYSLNSSRTIEQIYDGQRGITNSRIKKMFKHRKYYIYDGTAERAEAIYKDWQSVISGKDESEVEKAIDDLYYGTSTSTISYTEDPRNEDLINNIDINIDSLNAFSILENTHTLDAEYAYRDFKELIVELNYFDKEDLSDKIPEVFTWILPELQSTWPIRVIDKSENYYGTYIHSNEAIKNIKDTLGIKENEDGEVKIEVSEDTETIETISEEDAQILNSAKGYDYAGETLTTEEIETEEGESPEKTKAAIGEVISPVTGEVIAYGTYERINTDLVKYKGLSEEEAKEEVGYIQIKIMDSEYFDESWIAGNTDVGVGTEEATEKYSNAEALNAYYKEYEDVCEGYIVTIDGIKLLDGATDLESLINLSDDKFKVTESFEPNITANLVDDELEESNQQKENAKAAAPAVAKNGGKIYVREGTIIGYTTKNENSIQDYSYIRIILRDDEGSERENIENYFDLPERVSVAAVELAKLDSLSKTSTKEEKIKAAISYFVSEGFTEEGAAGIVGNIFQESRFEPTADNGNHYGICQWNYVGVYKNPTGGRWKKILSWMESNGYNYDSFAGQLMAILKSEDAKSYTGYIEQIKKATTVEQATDVWCRHYEICGNYDEEVPKRTTFGEDALKVYKGELTEFPHS